MGGGEVILYGKHTISAYTGKAQLPVFMSQYINGNYYSFTYTAQPSMVAALPAVFHNKINSGFFSVPAFVRCLSL